MPGYHLGTIGPMHTLGLYLKVSYFQGVNGAPGRIRTCDHPLRRRMLYPAELRAPRGLARAVKKLGDYSVITTPTVRDYAVAGHDQQTDGSTLRPAATLSPPVVALTVKDKCSPA